MKCKKENCNAYTMKGTNYCFSHNPNTKKEHIEAVKKGGSVTKETGLVNLEPLSLKRPDDTIVLLEDTINRVRRVREDGTMDLKTANSIGYLVGQLLKAMDISDLAARLEIVERVIFERKSLIKK